MKAFTYVAATLGWIIATALGVFVVTIFFFPHVLEASADWLRHPPGSTVALLGGWRWWACT